MVWSKWALDQHWLPNFIPMDKKPENWCEIQISANGGAWVMLRLKLVKNADDEDAHLAALAGDGGFLMEHKWHSIFFSHGQVCINQELFVLTHISSLYPCLMN